MNTNRLIDLTVILLAVSIAVIDYVAIGRYSFYLFYFPPIMYLTWYKGKSSGYIAALFCSTAWFLAYLHSNAGEPPGVLVWNTAIRLFTFAFVARITFSVRKREVALAEAQEKMVKLLARETYQSHHDPLTKILNSRALHEKLTEERLRCKRYNHPLSLLYVDLDGFKEINDMYGHTFGDECLKNVASAMKRELRPMDQIGRVGGDEFVVLLPETGSEGAWVCAQRILDTLKNEVTPSVTASVGVVCYATLPEDNESMISSADYAMYQAKWAGKNQIFVDNPE